MPTNYLEPILARQAVDTGTSSPVRAAAPLMPAIRAWGGTALVGVQPSGSFAKGTANKSGTDIDLFISLSANTTTSLQDIYNGLFNTVAKAGFKPTRQNVSINVRVGGYDIDLVPGKLQTAFTTDHSLWRNRAQTWTKTNISTHIATVRNSGRTQEIRALKLWRNQKGLEFPSFYLELSTIEALRGTSLSTLDQRVWSVLHYFSTRFENARVVDPANTANIISDDLTVAEKRAIAQAAAAARRATQWSQIIV
jgi:hypothetical protein